MEYSISIIDIDISSFILSFFFCFFSERGERDFNRIIRGTRVTLYTQNFDGTRKVAITNF